MNSKETNDSKKEVSTLDKWLPELKKGKTDLSDTTREEMEKQVNEMLYGDKKKQESQPIGTDAPTDRTIDTGEPKTTIGTEDSQRTVLTESADTIASTPATAPIVSTLSKRIGNKQRKESLEQYKQIFLTVPKLDDRKPVFISREIRDRLDEIVRRLGGRRMSVSGFIENLARHHLEIYEDDLEIWKRL